MKSRQTIIVSLVFLVTVATWIFDLWGIKYANGDDMAFALTDYGFWKHAAEVQGRFQFYLMAPFALFPYIINSTPYINCIRILSLLGIALSASLTVAFLLKDKRLIPIAILTISLLWQNSLDGYNLMVSYPFYLLFFNSLLYISVILTVYSLKNDSAKSVVFAAIALFVVFLALGEFAFQYLPAFAIIFLLYRTPSKNSLYWKKILILSAGLLSAAVITLYYRHVHPSEYDGNTHLVLAPARVVRTYLTLNGGLFPICQVIINKSKIFSNHIHICIALLIALISGATLVLSRRWLAAFKFKSISRTDKALIACLAVSMVAAPNLFVSLTAKYQRYVIESGITNATYSSFSYVALASIISIIIFLSSKKKILYCILSASICLGIFLTQLNNLYVSGVQRKASEKWDLLESSVLRLKSDFGDSLKSVCASDTLLAGVPPDGYWSDYCSKKMHIPLQFDSRCLDDIYLNYLTCDNKDGIILIEKNSTLLYIVTKHPYSDRVRDYLVEVAGGDTQQRSTKIQSDKFAEPQKIANSFVYKVDPPFCMDKLIGNSKYNFLNNSTLDGRVEYKEGVYDLEQFEGDFWRWAKTPVRITFCSHDERRARLTMRLHPAQDMKLDISINNRTETYICSSGKDALVEISFLTIPGANQIAISSNVAPKRLSNTDTRLFSFMIKPLVLRDW